ncbi:Importin subunit alpha-7, partial [Fragariocoptes setiger]
MSNLDSHRSKYKNAALDTRELRRRREEEGVQLRKQKRDEELRKRRTMATSNTGDDMVSDSWGSSSRMPQQGFGQQPDSTTSDGPVITEEMIVALQQDENLQLIIDNSQRVRKILSKEPQPPIDEVISSGLIPRFAKLLERDTCAILQFEVAWVLTNVASGTSAQTKTVVDAGAARTFIRLLESPHAEVKEQAVWALGNIAGDSPDCRDYLLNQGIMKPLIALLQEPGQNITLTRNAVWALSNLCRGKNPPANFDQVKDSLPVLANLLTHNDVEVLSDTCWALSYLCDGPNEKIQAVINAGVCRRLVELLRDISQPVVSAAIRAVGNIVTGEDVQTQVIVNCGAIPCLKELLSSNKESLRKEACWTVSNITAGNKTQIQAVIEAGLFPILIELINKGEVRTRKEAAWAITNATSGGSVQQVRYLVEVGSIQALCDLLGVVDNKMVHVALNGLENILRAGELISKEQNGSNVNPYSILVEQCGGLDKIEYLQSHENPDIYQKAYNMIEKYFGTDDDQTNLDPTVDVNNQQYQFNANSGEQTSSPFNF